MAQDKQLSNIKLETVLQKQQLGQALNAKEFAVLAGVSYSTARQWFRTKGFPALKGLVFWQDFITWHHRQTGLEPVSGNPPEAKNIAPPKNLPCQLPEKARKLLSQV
ncbi:MAG TPA: hypothetical protein VMV89_11985 [Candidatus Paceibacterota bacterium]|nr:hypothetical protein [Candidatus Paceibacterota bacterium]